MPVEANPRAVNVWFDAFFDTKLNFNLTITITTYLIQFNFRVDTSFIKIFEKGWVEKTTFFQCSIVLFLISTRRARAEKFTFRRGMREKLLATFLGGKNFPYRFYACFFYYKQFCKNFFFTSRNRTIIIDLYCLHPSVQACLHRGNP